MSIRVIRMALVIAVGLRLSGLLASLGAETQGPEKAPVSLWEMPDAEVDDEAAKAMAAAPDDLRRLGELDRRSSIS
jgi:hypothetical protein